MSTNQISVIDISATTSSNEIEDENDTNVNRQEEDNTVYWRVLHIFTILGACSLSLSIEMLIPRHNTIFYPSYWYELVFVISIPILIAVMRRMAEIYTFTKARETISINILLKMYLLAFVPFLICYMVSYYCWTSIMELNHPLPLQGIGIIVIVTIMYLCSPWLAFPSDLLDNDEFNEKLRTYLKYTLWWLFMNIQRDILTFLFKNITKEFQFLVAITIPAVKEMNKKVLVGLVKKMSGGNDDMSNVVLGIRLNIHYALFIAIRLTGAALISSNN